MVAEVNAATQSEDEQTEAVGGVFSKPQFQEQKVHIKWNMLIYMVII